MQFRIPIVLSIISFFLGFKINDYGLQTGSIVFTNFSTKKSVTFSEVILIGERKFLRRETSVIGGFELYDQEGNRLLRVLRNSSSQTK